MDDLVQNPFQLPFHIKAWEMNKEYDKLKTILKIELTLIFLKIAKKSFSFLHSKFKTPRDIYTIGPKIYPD